MRSKPIFLVLLTFATSLVIGCSQSDPNDVEQLQRAAVLPTEQLWVDATPAVFGDEGWTHKLELSDVNGDGKVDVIFANGPQYSNKGVSSPQMNRVFLNAGNDAAGNPTFKDIAKAIKLTIGFSRAIKARDVNNDGRLDLFFGTTHHSGPSRLFLGKGSDAFEEVSATNLPTATTAMGDADLADVDGDGDIDIAIANWGKGEPCVAKVPGCPQFINNSSPGGQVLLWLNNGQGKFTDATQGGMPATLIKFSWDLEFVDIDNDRDLDLAIASKGTLGTEGSFLFKNDGKGKFTDVTAGNLPQFPNNYEFEIIDFNGDGSLDLLTFNDGKQQTPGSTFDLKEHIFINDGDGKYSDLTSQLWPDDANIGEDDNHGAVFDFDSDGDQDWLIGSLFGDGVGAFNGNGFERLMVNQDGKIAMKQKVLVAPKSFDSTPGTLGIAVADLNGDGRPDVVQSQGESAFAEKLYIASAKVPVDSKAPIIDLAEDTAVSGNTLLVRTSVYDRKTPVADSDFLFKDGKRVLPFVRIKHPDRASFEANKAPMSWYGGTLWRADVKISNPVLAKKSLIYQVCATDAAGNEACQSSDTITLP